MKKTITSFLFCLLVTFASSQSDTVVLQNVLDSLQKAGNYPGLSLAIIFPNNKSLALTSGYNDKEKNLPLKTIDRLMQGSVGKTYVAALTMQLLKEKKFNLDDKVSKYLGRYEWYARIPNAADVTIRILMNHTSGVMRYEFKESFSRDLATNPDKHWKPEELLSYILDEHASFKAGEGWEYSDTNYILLGMIIEAVTGNEYFDLVQERILNPLKLSDTFFSKSRWRFMGT